MQEKNGIFDTGSLYIELRIQTKVFYSMQKYTKYLLFLVLVAVCLPTGLMAQTSPGKAAYREAENLRKAGKCNDAIIKYDEAIRLESSNYKYYFQKGKCQSKLKNYDGAKESFLSAVEYKPEFTSAYALLAKIYRNERDYDNAIRYYEEAARYEQKDSRKVHYKLLLVNLLLKEDRVYDAKRHIADAKSLNPQDPNVLYYDGEINAMEENWEDAKGSYLRALNSEELKSAAPAKNAKYYYGLGLAYSKLGDNVNAKKAWAKANFGPYKKLIQKEMIKSNHVYYYKIAISYYINGEYEASEEQIEKALEIQRDFASAYVLKGNIARKQGNVSRAIDYYEQAVGMEKDPKKKAKLYSKVASLQLSNNDYYGALSSLGQIGNINSPKILFLRAKAEYGSGRYSEASTTLSALLKMGVDAKTKARYSFLLGMASKKDGNYEAAKEAFKNAMYGTYKPAAKYELEILNKK